MPDYKEIMKEIDMQEQELVFKSFTYDDAFRLGTLLYMKAKARELPIAVDITRNGQQLFHAALPGSSPDNDQWIIRKSRVVNRFGRSSFYVANQLADEGTTIEARYHVSAMEFSPNGGSFPITIRDVGAVGTITVSGLPQEEDHRFVTETIREFLK